MSGTREQHVTHGTGRSLGGGKPTETEVTLLLVADDVLAAPAGRLVRRFAPGVGPRSLGKLATGSALAMLIERRGAEALPAADGRVRPAAFDAIGSAT